MSEDVGAQPAMPLRRRWAARLASAIGRSAIDVIGRGTKFSGRPDVSNDGLIVFGRDCVFGSRPIQSHLVVMAGARVTVGDRVVISYGAALSALHAIEIGDDTQIGPFCVILDNDFHKVGDRDSPGLAAPVQIGRGVRIGARVTMLRGARIGDGATVLSGSTISGVVASGATVSGVPARPVGREAPRKADPGMALVAMRVFDLAEPPGALDGPGSIARWDGAGAVRLLLALEDAYAITLSVDRVRNASNLADLSRLVALARGPAGTATVP